ncbi:tRNA uracil 4-sulfurtransferase ThiI [Patescibacteria group bacterium]
MERILVISVGELALKGKNRAVFEKRLVLNLETAFVGLDVKVQRRHGRFIVEPGSEGGLSDEGAVHEIIQRIFGVSAYAFAYLIENDYATIEQTALELIKEKSFSTFAVRTKRVDKSFSMTSSEIDKTLGAAVVKSMNKKVDLTNPELTVGVKITEEGAYISFEKFPGAGGLPVGTSGKMLSLLSSGIDSPIASWRMMKRGATVNFIHFHSYPMTSRASIENTEELVRVLQRFQPPTKLYLAPLVELQKEIVQKAPEKFRVVMYRRAMLQIAEQLARRIKAKALVTGESLGQVASQTMQNMTATSSGIELPIFRPLIGMDKQEIIDEAQQIGTYDISIRPYEDCCSLLMPQHVETHANLDEVSEIEQSLPWQQLIDDVLKQIEEKEF